MRIRADRQTGAGSDRAHQSATNQPLHLRYKRMEAACKHNPALRGLRFADEPVQAALSG